jgi:hypothetical protein
MRILSIATVGVALTTAAVAQQAPEPQNPGAAQVAAPPTSSPLRLFRWDEDWSDFADPDRHAWPLDVLKHVPLGEPGDDAFLSLGGELRWRFESVPRRALGASPIGRDDFLLQRYFVHVDAHANESARLFVQVGAGAVAGESFASPPSQANDFDLVQGFFDLDLDLGAASTLRVRGGRQELGFGSYRLVTVREPTNFRLTFDGVRTTWRTGASTIDVFHVRPVAFEGGVLDDAFDRGQALWGAYSAHELSPQGSSTIDLYYLGLARDATRFETGVGDELRHSVGARLSGRAAGWDHDTEALIQFGDFTVASGEQSIRAWTIASNTGHTFQDTPWRPRVGVKANIASGDDDPTDDELGTFNALFPRNNYFNEAGFLAPANFFDVHPSLVVRPDSSTTLTASWDIYFRAERSDAVFGPTGIVVPAGASDERFVGSTLSLQIERQLWRGTLLSIAYVHLFAGPVVEDAGGGDLDYVTLNLGFRF